MPITRSRQLISDCLVSEVGAQWDFLAGLVRDPTDNPPGDCAAVAESWARRLEELGYNVERHGVPSDLARKHGMLSVTNLVVRQRFGDGPTIALNAHGDVVPPGDGWTTAPYGAEIHDGQMYGRGAAVSKCDIATYTWVLRSLREIRHALKGSVELHITFDEETGGALGPKWLLDEGIVRPHFTICAGFSYHVVVAHNGCLHLEVEVRGRQAHAAIPDTGVDALQVATDILSAIYEHRETLTSRKSNVEGIGSPTLVVGLINGGINTNVVPDVVTFRLDRRLIPEESGMEVEREVTSLIEQTASAHSAAQVRVRRVLLAQPLTPIAGSDKLADVLCRNATVVMGEPIPAQGVPLYTDARHYSAAGVPTVLYGAGPRTLLESRAKNADERIALCDLEKATKAVAFSVAELLSGATADV